MIVPAGPPHTKQPGLPPKSSLQRWSAQVPPEPHSRQHAWRGTLRLPMAANCGNQPDQFHSLAKSGRRTTRRAKTELKLVCWMLGTCACLKTSRSISPVFGSLVLWFGSPWALSCMIGLRDGHILSVAGG